MKIDIKNVLREFIRTLSQITGTSIRFVKILVLSVMGFGIFLFAALTGIYIYFAQGLPEIHTIMDYKPPVISEVFAKDGTRIGEFWEECRIFVPYDKIPKLVAGAFVDAEDARFFSHKGVDVRSIFRAFYENLKAGSIQQGGSTITQQVTRALLLTREKKLSRKIKEAILATRLERYLDKEEILTLYLNQLYLGNRAYGVAAAARNYFHKQLEELSIGQIALIAGLPTAPSDFSPINSPKDARVKQLHVLGRMVDQGHITEEQAKSAAAEEFEIFVADIDKSFFDKDSAYFTEHVRRIVKEKYGDEVLYKKGLKIYSTLDLPMQRAAANSIRKGVESMDRRQGYRGPVGHVSGEEIESKAKELMVALLAKQASKSLFWPPDSSINKKPREPKFDSDEKYLAVVTGFEDKNVIAKIGDKSFTITRDGYKWARSFNPSSFIADENGSYVDDPRRILKAGDIILIKVKEDGTATLTQEPMIESALVAVDPHTGFIQAMMGGYDFGRSEFNRATQSLRQPGSSFKPFIYAAALDKGYTLDTVVQDAPVSYNFGEFWAPKNYDGKFRGPISVKTALTLSRNVPTVRIAHDIGTHYITAYARKIGLTSPIQKYLSMALGANGVYLQDMVRSYATFANGGISHPLVCITKIENNKGEVIEETPVPDFKTLESAPSAMKFDDESAANAKKNGKKKESASEDEEKAPIGRAVKLSELNDELLESALKVIESDKLVLTDQEIKTLYGKSIPPGHAMTPQSAYIMTQVLKNVVDNGTGTRVKPLGKPVAGKTGTTNDETDIWFVGFTPELAAGIWMGFDEIKSIGKKATGGVYVAPMFLDFMTTATKDHEPKDFAKPEGFPNGPVEKVAGGSTVRGARPIIDFGPGQGSDRAGEFFEEELEEGGGRLAPPSRADEEYSGDDEGF